MFTLCRKISQLFSGIAAIIKTKGKNYIPGALNRHRLKAGTAATEIIPGSKVLFVP